MMKFSDFAALLLRSKLHWLMGGATMLDEVTGSKTGKKISLPVNFIRDGLDLWVISSRDRVWWRNLRQNPQARIWVGGKPVQVRAELVLEQDKVADRLLDLCAR
jgi:deazaflavin-dependent oxidoreductase (nitroreductase family)